VCAWADSPFRECQIALRIIGFPKAFIELRLDCLMPIAGAVMPKMKTHNATKKRFRLSANGKPKHRGAGTSHLASRMSQKRKRNLRGTRVADKTITPMIQQALGKYSS
jgi:large subunit ribosomal protein L35